MRIPRHEIHFLPHGGWCPNSPERPVLIYHDALDGEDEPLAAKFEKTFASHGWPPAWRYTIFDYPHFHSTTHEVIGIFRGEADVRLGDTVGLTVHLCPRDVLIIPAGVSHERLGATADFQGVGAYPEDCEVDEQRIGRSDPAAAARRISMLPLPDHDPLLGPHGLLRSCWTAPVAG